MTSSRSVWTMLLMPWDANRMYCKSRLYDLRFPWCLSIAVSWDFWCFSPEFNLCRHQTHCRKPRRGQSKIVACWYMLVSDSRSWAGVISCNQCCKIEYFRCHWEHAWFFTGNRQMRQVLKLMSYREYIATLPMSQHAVQMNCKSRLYDLRFLWRLSDAFS